jgi:hypothetical protein
VRHHNALLTRAEPSYRPQLSGLVNQVALLMQQIQHKTRTYWDYLLLVEERKVVE